MHEIEYISPVEYTPPRPPRPMNSPYVQDAGLIGQGCSIDHPICFGKTRHQRTRRGRVTAPSDLEPPKGLGFGLGLGLGLGLGWEAWGRVGLGRRARLKLTTHVLHQILYRSLLHIVGARPMHYASRAACKLELYQLTTDSYG